MAASLSNCSGLGLAKLKRGPRSSATASGLLGAVRSRNSAAVPAGRIYTVADIAADPQYQARDMILQTRDAHGRSLKVPGIVPKLSDTPGRLRTPAPQLGEHTEAVLGARGWPRG